MKRIFAAVIFTLFAVTAPAHAATIRWNLDGEGFGGLNGSSLTFTGFFDYDTSLGGNQTINDGIITVFKNGSPFFTWDASGNACCGASIILGGKDAFIFAPLPPQPHVPPEGMELDLITDGPLDGSVSTVPLIPGLQVLFSPTPVLPGSVFNDDGLLVGVGGSLTEAVPLPAALPLFGSGIIALAGIAVRRRWGEVSQ